MKRFLHIDVSPFFGGAQASLATLLSFLPGRHLLAATQKVLDASKCSNAIQLTTTHWPATPIGVIQLIRDLLRNKHRLAAGIAEFSPDIIVLNTIRSALFYKLLHIKFNCQLVLYDRDIKVSRLALKQVSSIPEIQVIAISPAVANKWEELLPESRIHVIPNGLPIDEISKTHPAQLPLDTSGDTVTVIQVADFEPWKRHYLFETAFDLAFNSNNSLRGIIKGRVHTTTGQLLLDELQEDIIKNEIGGVLKICHQDTSALPYIAASDILVACADNEPFGRTVIEALALGKTVITTPTACSEDILKYRSQSLVIVNDDSPMGIASKILELADRKRLAQNAASAYSIAQHFTMDALISNIAVALKM